MGVGDVQVTTSTFGLFFREALDRQGQDNYFGSGPVELGAMVVSRGCICCTHLMIAFESLNIVEDETFPEVVA